MTIDQLARSAGTTTRNVRALQTFGVLPRPVRKGRSGDYGPEHLDRLRSVLRLQEEGFSLAALRVLFDAQQSGRSLEEVLGLVPHPAGNGRDRHGEGDVSLEEQFPFDEWRQWQARSQRMPLALVPTTVFDARQAS